MTDTSVIQSLKSIADSLRIIARHFQKMDEPVRTFADGVKQISEVKGWD